jgi:Kef-type K+ transport system membrane component KefB
MKRIVLFLVTNLAVMLVLSIAASVLGVNRYLTANGLDLGTLLVFAGIMGFGGAFISLAMSKMMAKWSTGARIIDSPSTSTEFWLVETVRKQAEKAGIAMPEVAIYEGAPNAFATGPSRNNSLVAVSTGLLQSMSKEEVEAVLAHEVSHVGNGDMVTLTLIQGVVNTFVIFLSRIVGLSRRQLPAPRRQPVLRPRCRLYDHRGDLRHPVRHSRQHHRRLVFAPARIPRRRRRRRPDGFAAADDRGPAAPGRHGSRAAAEGTREFRHCRRPRPDGAVRQPSEHGRAHRRALGARPVSLRLPQRYGRPPQIAGAFAFLFAAAPAWAAASDVVGINLLWLALILMSARLFAPLAQRLGFPAVLGELLLGVLLGNLALLGINGFDSIKHDPTVKFIAELGVIVLLLQIGLETRLADLIKVGPRALAVGSIGIVVPFVLGAFVMGPWLAPGLSGNAYLFLGATLAATSVGITGRVFRDLGKLDTPAARIVLGAAVIDDVLGLVILAVVTSLVQAGSVSVGQVGGIIAEAVIFLAGSIWIGRLIAPHSSRWLAQLDAGPSMLFAQVLAAGLFLAWLAHAIGLAPIIGAFAAGLLFEPIFLRDFDRPAIVREIEPLLPASDPGLAERLRPILKKHGGHQHEHMIEPIGYFFVPVFFVLTGMQVDLQTFADPKILVIGLGVTLVAIAGKLVAGLAAGSSGKWVVGWGMVPRGEVGLIFAMVGKNLGVMNEAMFSVIVLMVILTTLITPPVLTWLLRRQ